MNITKSTNITVDASTYLGCFVNEDLGTATLYLHGLNESISIHFQPENLPVLENLVAQLQRLKHRLQREELQQLQRQIDALQNSIVNGNRKGAIVGAIELNDF